MSIFSLPGFSVTYYFLTLISIEASFGIALGHWQRSLSLKSRRFAIAFGILGVFRLVTPYFLSDAIHFDQMLAVVSLGILTWCFSPYLSNHPVLATIFLILNTFFALTLFTVNLFMPFGISQILFFLWQIGLGILLIVSQFYEFTIDQIFAVIGITVLIFGAIFQMFFGNSLFEDANAILIRISELIAYPLLTIAVYQEVIQSLNSQRLALKNLSKASQEQIQGLISLFETTKNIVSSLDLSQVLDGAAKGVVQTLNVDQCAIALPEEGEGTLLRMVASYNPHREGRGESITFPIGEQQAIKHAMERLRTVEINSTDTSPQIKFLFAMMGARNETGPLILQPLIFKNEAIGVLIVGNAHSKHPFGPVEIQLVKTLANQIVNAIDNARTYQILVTKSQQLAWTLRNNEQDAGRRRAAMEAELKKSREEATIISQQLYEQELLTRKGQKELTEYQQQANQLNQQLKTVREELQNLTLENRQLSNLTESHKKQLETLQKTENELNELRNQVQELEIEASQAQKLSEALKATQEHSHKLAKALRISRSKIQQMANIPATMTSPQISKDLENLSCGVLISDTEGNINHVNAATTELFSVHTNELVGKKLSDIASDEEWLKALQKITTGKETLVSTKLTIAQNIIKATISPITDPDNHQTNGNVVILYDATEEFESQQARDEFVASLAQELRTPMTSIIGYVDLLQGESIGIVSGMQRKFLQRVKANIERMDSLLNDLTGIAAIDAGQLELKTTSLNMAEVIEDAIISAKTQLEEKDIQLHLALPEQTPPIEADPNCMQQVMSNLIGNATKSTPTGGKIEVKAIVTNGQFNNTMASRDDKEEKWLKVSITDCGGGIAEKDVDHVFERFYKSDTPLIQGLGETGVGLSIVKHLIEAHGGKVWFDTEMGRGTTFHFTLPINDYFDDPWQEIDVPPLDLNSDI